MRSNGCFGCRSQPASQAKRQHRPLAYVSTAVGTGWFRHRGGMPLFMSNNISVRYLSFAERKEIGLLRAQSIGVREIARQLGRSPSTVSRELTRNAATRCGRLEYRASVAQWKAELVAKRPKSAKLVTNPRLHPYVRDRFEESHSPHTVRTRLIRAAPAALPVAQAIIQRLSTVVISRRSAMLAGTPASSVKNC